MAPLNTPLAQAPWSSILFLITVVRNTAKETEETIGFFVTFSSLVTSELEVTL